MLHGPVYLYLAGRSGFGDLPQACHSNWAAFLVSIVMHCFYRIALLVRATAVRQDTKRDAVLAGDPKGLDYYVILI